MCPFADIELPEARLRFRQNELINNEDRQAAFEREFMEWQGDVHGPLIQWAALVRAQADLLLQPLLHSNMIPRVNAATLNLLEDLHARVIVVVE